MQKGRMLALVTAASVVMGAFGVQAWTAGRETAASNRPVLLRGGTIYMTTAAAEGLGTVQGDETSRGLYVVQFTGPVKEAYKSALVRLGAELGDYLPENAFLVRMSPGQVTKVKAQGFVKGIVRYTPVYKVDSAIARLGEGQPVRVAIRSFGVGTKGPVSTLATLGVKPESIGIGTLTATVTGKQVQSLAASSDVVYIEPVLTNKLLNDKAAGVMGVSTAWGAGLDGKGQIVAVTDTGLDTGKNDASLHPDFKGQVKSIFALGRSGDASDPNAHGTHVAGSVLGSGAASNGQMKGMAPGAKLVFQSVLDGSGGLGGIPEDLNQIFRQAYDQGARVHTNSWGVPATQGGTVYDAQAASVDRFIWENPDYTILFAAGNDGDHDRDSKTNYSTVSTPGTSKNAITVGASQNDRPDKKMAADTAGMASFSSRGPTSDGRVKPDVVAPGTWIASTRSSKAGDEGFWAPHESNSKYGYMGGTSMATPLTAGATALVRQFYVEKLGITPRASLLKATLINGAASMNSSTTWKDAGWGRVDIKSSLYGRTFKYVNEEKALQTGEAQTYTYTVKASQPLKVTLAWTDYPASPSAAKTLVNDLDLSVKGPDGQELLGNHMLGPSADRINNVENVVVTAPKAGTYTVTVKAYNVPQGPQRFAMVVGGDVDGGAGQPTPPPGNPDPNPPAPDKQAPVVSVSSPADGSTVSGGVRVTVDATDNVGVSKVQFYVDGREAGLATAAPFGINWDSTTVADGAHTLVANAYDAAGNVGISKTVQVNVKNAGVTAAQEFQFTGKASAYGAVARHYVDVKAGGAVTAEIGLTGWGNLQLAVLDPSGRQIGAGTGRVGVTATTSGTYTLAVVSQGAWGDYSLKVGYLPAPGTAMTSKSGTVSAVGQRYQTYRITLAKAGSLNAAVVGADRRADLDLYVVNELGMVIAQGISPNLSPETVSARLGAGTYTIYVVADSGKADYQLTVVHPQ